MAIGRFRSMATAGEAEMQGNTTDGRIRVREAAVTTIAALVVKDGFQQLSLGEVRPKGWRNPDLGIGNLPKQEIADAQFATGADEQVRIGHSGGVKVARNQLFIT